MKQPDPNTAPISDNETDKSLNLIKNEKYLSKLEIQRRLLYQVMKDLKSLDSELPGKKIEKSINP